MCIRDSAEAVQGVEHPERVAAIGLDAPAMLVPDTRAHDIVSHAARLELAMQDKAQRPRLVAGDDPKAASKLFVNPAQKIGGLETLGRFGMRAFLLDGRDVKSQMHVQRDLEQGLELRLNLGLSCTSNSARNGVVTVSYTHLTLPTICSV